MNCCRSPTPNRDYDAWGNTVSQTGSTSNVYRYRVEQYDSDLNLYLSLVRNLPVSGLK